MRASEYKAIQRYVNKCKPLLGLRDWEIIVQHEEPDDPDHLAAYNHFPARKCANLRFRDDFVDEDDMDQRATVIHEMLHCVHSEPQDQIRYVLKHITDNVPAATTFEASWFHTHEVAIDTLSMALAPLFPPVELPN